MSHMLSHPFRFLPGGSAATVEQDTDAGNAQEIAFLLLTIRGERVLDPDYGLTDPTFVGVDTGEVTAQVERYVPGVDISAVVSTIVDDSTFDVAVEFSDVDVTTSPEQGHIIEA